MKYILIILIGTIVCQSAALDSPYLGVFIEDLNASEKAEYGISEGVIIEDIVPDSPAEKAGLSINGIILKINNHPIIDSNTLKKIIMSYRPGDDIVVQCLYNGNILTKTVVLEARKNNLFPEINILSTKTKHLGLKLQNLTGQLKEFFGIVDGVLVAEVMPETPAEKAGIKAGDVIVSTDGISIDSSSELREVIKDYTAGETVTIVLVRGAETISLEVEIEETENLFSIDLNNQIIFLGKDQVIDISGLGNWFNSGIPDSTKQDIERQLQELQQDIDRLKQRFLTK